VIIPDGGTELEAGDRLVVLADEGVLPGLHSLLRG
jgi:Trk K+ transport system NAD-binding subunit